MGGAWSNHLHALAYCSNLLGLRSIGYVRGEELNPQSNAMLAEASEWGMHLRFLARSEFRAQCQQMHRNDLSTSQKYKVSALRIPEGGDGWLGVAGVATMLQQLQQLQQDTFPYSMVVCAVGTGCTFAGLRLGLPKPTTLLGISALKGQWQRRQMGERLRKYAQGAFVSTDNVDSSFGHWDISDQFCCGGFGKRTAQLSQFIGKFAGYTGIPIEPIYSAKVFFGLNELARQGKLASQGRILVVHGGGVQGLRGFSC